MGKSSKDKRDAYYRLAKEQGWRARSAFKLIQIDEQFDLFRGVSRVVDLCAAPGSWSQVLSRVLIKGEKFGRRAWEERHTNLVQNVVGEGPQGGEKETAATLTTRESVRIVSVDLQPISKLDGIETIVADITHPTTIPRILRALDPETFVEGSSTGSTPVDLVISDGAPDVTGLHDLDIYVQAQLLFSALNLAIRVLRPGGSFVAKIFRAKDVDLIYAQLRCFFKEVHCAKPRSSRASSLEAFVVCRGFELPRGYDIDHDKPVGLGADLSELLNKRREGEKALGQDARGLFCNGQRKSLRKDGVTILEFEDEEAKTNRWIAPFVACGDLSAFDSDATYHLPPDHVALDPVQPPTAPPYKRALEVRRQQGGFYGKTGKKG